VQSGALTIEDALGVAEYGLVLLVALIWAGVIGRLWLLSPAYLTQTTSKRTGDIVMQLGPQHLSIAGLVLAALSVGTAFQSAAPLLIVSLCAFLVAYVVGGTPQANAALIGGDAMSWSGIATLLGAVFLYSQRFGLIAEAGVFLATSATLRGSLINTRSFLTDAEAVLSEVARPIDSSGVTDQEPETLVENEAPMLPIGQEPRVLFFPALGSVGAALFWLLNGTPTILHLPVPSHLWDLVFLGLTLIGLLLVPASIFVAVVGSMFSNYDRATPVTLVGGWSAGIFRVVAFSAGYGLMAALYLVFDQPISQVAVIGFVCLVAIGLANVIWLVDASMSLLDPDRLTRRIANYVVHPLTIGRIGRPDDRRVNQVMDDLSRLTRGLADRSRPTAAAHAIDRISEVWKREHDRIGQKQRELVSRVLGECAARDNDDLTLAIARFTRSSGILPDPVAQQRTVLRLVVEGVLGPANRRGRRNKRRP
jgi:hypothetical protein